MHKDATSKVQFKFLDAQLLVHRIKPNPSIPLALNTVLHKGEPARYNLTIVELKTLTFSKGSKSSIDNAVLGPLPKRLLFTMVQNTEFLGSINSNPYLFRHYDITIYHACQREADP
jgi:hypothetical protein